MSWLLLFLAIVLEVCGTISMRLSQGFTRLIPSVALFVFYALSFSLVTLTLKRIELSVAYAVWAGLGTALVTIAGVILFKEAMTPLKMLCIGLIIISVVGLNLSGRH